MANLKLIDSGSNKLQIIKLVKDYTNLGLKESKDIIDNVPSLFYVDENQYDIELIITEFKKNGANVIVDQANLNKNDFVAQTGKKVWIKIIMAGFDKEGLIKLIKEYGNLGLKETNDLIDNIPSVFEVQGTDFFQIRSKFSETGAWIEEATLEEIEGLGLRQKNRNSTNQLKIELISTGNHKIEVVKLIRIFSGLGLKESKDMMDNVPSVFTVENHDYDFEQIKKNFDAIGAVVKEVREIAEETRLNEQGLEEIPSKPGASGMIDNHKLQHVTITSQIKTDSETKFNNQFTDIDGLILQNQTTVGQSQNIRNAVIFVNLAAIFMSLNMFYHFSIIFILAFVTAYLLRKSNAASKQLGIRAFLLVLNYFVLKSFINLIIWPFLLGNSYGLDLISFIQTIFYPGNITILIAAGLSYFFASSERMFKKLNKDQSFDNIH